MIEETGIVKRVKGKKVWIETQVKTTCGSCHVSDNCGTSVVAKAFTNKPELLELDSDISLVEGQTVKLGIPESQLVFSSMLVYLLPILSLIGGVLLVKLLMPEVHEAMQILVGFFAFGLCFWLLNKKLKQKNKAHFSPLILGALNEASVIKKHEIPVKKLV
ncbi:SoxR reducing system RseC family protein [Glaciecola sp. MH2013]|uniref:SoxR reducing system RseC family protein n=1 Tax=Glaciecola sp. MH2013 TaxID=2785524 RepID=UPI0018A0947B|nr:SoxR reducing system RseC family protein [Glaciecola sp. MH2013]MBF7074729.1 SoxR reducing system RseC family protein [Glaciecola sp. MH2013]